MSARVSWPYLVGVGVLAAGLGTLIAGVPDDASGLTYRIPDGGSVVTVAPPSFPPIDTFDPSTMSTVSTLPETTPPTTTVPATTVPATTLPTTTLPTTTAVPPTEAPVRPRAEVRLVVANGDGRFNLVGANVARLRAVGYVTIDETDVAARPPTTVIHVRPGFEREALVLAADLQTPGALITPLTDAAVTVNDELGDLVVVLGPDAIR